MLCRNEEFPFCNKTNASRSQRQSLKLSPLYETCREFHWVDITLADMLAYTETGPAMRFL